MPLGQPCYCQRSRTGTRLVQLDCDPSPLEWNFPTTSIVIVRVSREEISSEAHTACSSQRGPSRSSCPTAFRSSSRHIESSSGRINESPLRRFARRLSMHRENPNESTGLCLPLRTAYGLLLSGCHRRREPGGHRSGDRSASKDAKSREALRRRLLVFAERTSLIFSCGLMVSDSR